MAAKVARLVAALLWGFDALVLAVDGDVYVYCRGICCDISWIAEASCEMECSGSNVTVNVCYAAIDCVVSLSMDV
ncbi:hypothetical protein HDV64DRAFT_250151, partial [Trichoderma sp. TUCIM 5745]